MKHLDRLISAPNFPALGAVLRAVHPYAWFWLIAAMSLHSLNAADTTNSPPEIRQPFIQFRDATLDYRGPERDQAERSDLKEVKIAWFGPQDSTNHLHASLWRAANLAVRQANEQGGCKGLPFRLVPQWSANPWGAGISQLARMIYDEEPVAVLGSVDSASTHLAEQVVAKAQLTLVSPISTDKSLTLAGVSWMFACAPTDDAIARSLVAGILSSPGAATAKIVLLSATDHESRMTVREVLAELGRHRHQPDFRFEFQSGSGVSTNQLESLRQIQPGIIVIVASAEDSGKLLISVKKAAPAAAVFGSHSMGQNLFLDIAGAAAEGVRFPLLFAPDANNPETATFIRQYEKDHSSAPDYAAAFAYDATRLLLEAIKRSGLNKVRIREGIGQISPWNGAGGTIVFDGTGHNTRTNIPMGRIVHGAVTARPESEKTQL